MYTYTYMTYMNVYMPTVISELTATAWTDFVTNIPSQRNMSQGPKPHTLVLSRLRINRAMRVRRSRRSSLDASLTAEFSRNSSHRKKN